LAGAAVTVTSATGGTARDTVTNAEELYNVPSLLPGDYNIKITAQGFSANETKGVELLTASDLSVDIQMSLATLQQTVSVQAQAALVEFSQSTQGGSVRPTEVAELPILNRTMAAVMILIAGAGEVSATVSSHGAHCRTASRYEAAAARTFKHSSTAPKTGRSVRRHRDQLQPGLRPGI
jgi:hypothetical protein